MRPARRSCSMEMSCIAGIWGPRDGRAGQSARPGRSLAAPGRTVGGGRPPARTGMAGRARRSRAPGGRARPRMGDGRGRPGTACALARNRVRLRHRDLFRHRPRARAMGGGAPARCGGRRRPCSRGSGLSRFPWRWVPPPWRPGWRPPPSSAPSSLTRCCRRRSGTSISRASSRSGKSASARTASSCGLSAWPVRGLTRRWSACGSRCARAPRRRSAAFVEFKARLSPPLEPLRPGGYDFARDMYFNRIGASGFVLGRIRVAETPHAPSFGCDTPPSRWNARGDRPAHPRRPARRQGCDRIGA